MVNNSKPHGGKNMLTLDSTQKWSPVQDIKDGIVFTKDGRYVQILEFAPINFTLLPGEEQEDIANAFGAAIKIFPDKFHLKVLSRRADVETHVRNLQSHIARETNPHCRVMQEDSIQQLRRESIEGVSRRFFLSFAYENPGGLRSPSWNDIRTSLWFQASQIESALSGEPCNNGLLSPIGSTDHVIDILYNCMSRAEAEQKPTESRIMDTICAHIVEQGLDINGPVNIPINDFIAPRKIDPSSRTSIEVDGKYYTFGYIHRNSYPSRCVAGWLSELVSMGEGFDIDLWVEKKSTKEITPQLTYAMQISRNNYLHKSNAAADLVALEDKMEAEEYLRMGISNGQEYLNFTIMVTAVGDSTTEVKTKFRMAQNYLLTKGLELRPCHFYHDLAFASSMPLCLPDRKITRFAKRNILSGDFGTAYPFTSYEINDPFGIPVGHNKANRSPLFLDLYNRYIYPNGNAIIFGTSGSGKTYLLQLLALRLRQSKTKTIIVAPYKGHEYRPACDAIGGSFISIAPGSPNNINIMEIRKYDRENDKALDGDEQYSASILAQKIQQIKTFFSIRKPDMTLFEERLLDAALQKVYKDKGITFRNGSLIDPKNPQKYKPMPILSDLYAELKNSGREARGLCDALYEFVEGSAKSFNGQTNVNLDNSYVVIDVSNMPDRLLPVAIFIAYDFVFDAIRADRLKRKALFMDELSKLIGANATKAAAEFVLEAYKTVRSFNCICICATQDTNDLFAFENGKYGKGVLANSAIKIAMKQLETEAPTLTEVLKLSGPESRQLTRFQRGDGLLIANRNHTLMQVKANPAEHILITTDPKQLEEILTSNLRGRRKPK